MDNSRNQTLLDECPKGGMVPRLAIVPTAGRVLVGSPNSVPSAAASPLIVPMSLTMTRLEHRQQHYQKTQAPR